MSQDLDPAVLGPTPSVIDARPQNLNIAHPGNNSPLCMMVTARRQPNSKVGKKGGWDNFAGLYNWFQQLDYVSNKRKKRYRLDLTFYSLRF
jgi:hypothetical protein